MRGDQSDRDSIDEGLYRQKHRGWVRV